MDLLHHSSKQSPHTLVDQTLHVVDRLLVRQVQSELVLHLERGQNAFDGNKPIQRGWCLLYKEGGCVCVCARPPTFLTVLSGSSAISGMLASTMRENRFRMRLEYLGRGGGVCKLLMSQCGKDCVCECIYLLSHSTSICVCVSPIPQHCVCVFPLPAEVKEGGVTLLPELLVLLALHAPHALHHLLAQLHGRGQGLGVAAQDVAKVNMEQLP